MQQVLSEGQWLASEHLCCAGTQYYIFGDPVALSASPIIHNAGVRPMLSRLVPSSMHPNQPDTDPIELLT